jgi:hypothetical protein
MAVDMNKLQEFLGRFVTDLGATFAAGNVVTGHHLGRYRALAAGPARAAELAERTSTNPRYITEWLCGQAAGGYVEYDPVTDTYSMTEEQAFALANPDGGVYIPGAFVLALGTLKAEPRITEAFRTGAAGRRYVPSPWSASATGRRVARRAGNAVSPATATSVPSTAVTSHHAGGWLALGPWFAAVNRA